MLFHKIPSYQIILSRNQRITSILLFKRESPLGTLYFPFCFSWILLKIPICDPRHIAVRNITPWEPFNRRSPAHDWFHHRSTFTVHSCSQEALQSWPTAATSLTYSWGSKRASWSFFLGHPPREVFFFTLWWGWEEIKRGRRGHDTLDVPATFHCSLENVIKRSSSLGERDYDTSLLSVIKGELIPVTKLRRRQGKCWTCHNLALITYLFIWNHKSTTSYTLRMQRWTNRNYPFTPSIYCLLEEIHIVTHLTMKSALWNINKTRGQSKSQTSRPSFSISAQCQGLTGVTPRQ